MRRRRFWFLRVQNAATCLILGVLSVINGQAQLGPPPKIDIQPVGLAVSEGGTATFAVTVSVSTVLTSPTFKWRRNGQGAGSGLTVAAMNTLVINNVRRRDAGTYTVEVKNAAGTVVSSEAFLLILTQPVVEAVQILSSGLTTNGFHLRLTGPPGSNYVIQASSDLTNWSSISTNAAPNGDVDFTDTTTLHHTRRFYRAFAR